MDFKLIVAGLACVLGCAPGLAHDIGHDHVHVEGGWNAKAGFVSDTDITAKLWNPRGKAQAEIDKRAEYVEQYFDGARTPEERAADALIRERYKDAIVINMLMPSGIGIQGGRIVGIKPHYQARNRGRRIQVRGVIGRGDGQGASAVVERGRFAGGGQVGRLRTIDGDVAGYHPARRHHHYGPPG